LRQFHALSNGQRLRAACARNLGSRRAIDDFAATVDEDNANCFAAGLAKLVRRERLKNVVVATTRRGVATWSQAEWVLVLNGGDEPRLMFNPGTPLERPRVASCAEIKFHGLHVASTTTVTRRFPHRSP
jgi:hypothetical protein